MAHYDDRGWGATVVVDPRRRDGDAHEDDGFDDVTYVRGRGDRVGAPELSPAVRFRAPVREFVRRYGWRAHALPILVVLTIVALATTKEPDSSKHPGAAVGSRTTSPAASQPIVPVTTGSASTTHTAGTTHPVSSSHPPAGTSHSPSTSPASSHSTTPTAGGSALPVGADYTAQGDGTFRVLKGTTKPFGTGTSVVRYDIEVENGITGINLTEFADLVDTTLADPRSWSGHGVTLERVDDASQASFHVSLTSSLTVRTLCGYEIPVETSCFDAKNARVVLNDSRWVRGDLAYPDDLHAYRVYMINHEDGHALGHMHAHECLANGMAPVMVQQTLGLHFASTGQTCTPNAWPYPTGVSDAPGSEQSDTAENQPSA